MKKYLVISSAMAKEQAPQNTKVLPWDIFMLMSVSLYDYDGIVIDATSIPKPEMAVNLQKGKQRQDFTMVESDILNPEAIHRILFNSKAFVVVIGNPSTRLENYSIADRLGISLVMTPSHGTNLVINCETKHPFYNYIKQIREYSYAFRNNARMNRACAQSASYFGEPPMLSVESLLSIKIGDSVAARIGGPGFSSLYLLPMLPSGIQCSIQQIFRILANDEDGEITEPRWTSNIVVAGQKEIDSRLSDIEHSISELEEKKMAILGEKTAARQLVEMLYKTGKPLERSIKTTLRGIGITVVEPPTENEREFTFEFGGQKFVVEVKSTERQFFNKDGLRQVIEWQNDVLMESGEYYKPVFITSNEVVKPVQDRNKDFLPPNLLNFAKDRQIAVISVSTLFEIVNMIKEGAFEVSMLIDTLVETNGIVNFDDKTS